MKARETAVVMIEFQNEFCNPDGKLYGIVKDELARQNTIGNAVKLVKGARAKGCPIVHVPFVFDEKWANEHCVTGIIGGAKEGGAFRPGAWGTEFIKELWPEKTTWSSKISARSAVSHTRSSKASFANTTFATSSAPDFSPTSASKPPRAQRTTRASRSPS